MQRILLKASIAGLALLAAGCVDQAGDIRASNFGDATANNTVVQAVRLRGAAINNINNRFRASAQDTVNFAFNRSDLDAQARAILDQQAAFIRSNPSVGFRVFGHTDLVGSGGYNRRLGLRRARAVVNYLVARGASRRQLQAVSSLGETRPIVNTPNRERLNRRTVTQVVGVTRDGRPFDFDGKAAVNIYNGYVTGFSGETGGG